MRRLAPLLLLLAGCGSPPADLFVVQRSGSGHNAKLTLLVQDDGYVICNHGPQHQISSARLLDARRLARDLEPQAQLHLALPPGPNSELSYKARMEAGNVSFSDTSRGNPKSFLQLAAFTKDVTEDICGIQR
jgi:hypothetical protein